MGLSPLHLAMERNGPTVIRLLLNQGTDIQAKTHFSGLVDGGNTPLHLAGQRRGRGVAAGPGADTGTRDQDGNTLRETSMQLRTLHGTPLFDRLCDR